MDLDISDPPLRPPLQERTVGIIREAYWALAAFCAVYLALILFGFHLSDPSWSHAVTNGVVMNPGGRFGAFVSDVLLYFFAHAAWWWVVFLIYVPLRGLRLWRQREDRRPLYISLLGFILLLTGSCAMESLHFYHRDAHLPYASGGVLGLALARFSFNYFGFVGSTLGLLVVLATGASLFFNFSWLSLCEKLGHLLESTVVKISAYWQARQDRRIGREMTLMRENKVEIAREKEQVHLPLHIEEPRLEVRPSPQLIKERQKPLFPDMPAQVKPPLELLAKAEEVGDPVSKETLEFTSRQIERKLSDFGVEAQVIGAYPGPVVARYELQPAVGVKGSQVINLAKDLARSLSVASVRIVETIPGKSCMGLELPNPSRQKVSLSQILGSRVYYDNKSPLPLGLGKDIAGQPVVVDLVRMPHLLVAGTTGSGKSVGINAMILSILYKTEVKDVRMILVDPKMLELGVYNGIGHLLSPVVTDMRLAAQALGWCVREMERRYQILSVLGVRNIAGFNQRLIDASKRGEVLVDPTKENGTPLTHLPYIVVVIDELADLMMVAGKQVEEHIARIAQKARAAGIHLILATQRPSVDVITGLIKANIPTRISFQVSSKIDSRTILDQMGAESLLGQGDMLFLEPGMQTPVRVHGAWVSDEEVHKVVEYLKRHGPPPAYEDFKEAAAAGEGGSSSDDPSMEDDPLYDQAVEVVLRARRASISLVQRHLRIGYNRSARLIERMEKEGLVSTMSSNGSREVLAPAPAGRAAE